MQHCSHFCSQCPFHFRVVSSSLNYSNIYPNWPPAFLEIQLLVSPIQYGIFSSHHSAKWKTKNKQSENRISPVSNSFLKENRQGKKKRKKIKRKKNKEEKEKKPHTQKRKKVTKQIVKEMFFVRNTSLESLLGGWACITGGFSRYFGSKTIYCEV